MISENQINQVYFSSLLPERFPQLFDLIVERINQINLISNTISYGLLPHTNDIWCRDYMPIQVSENKFVCFRYAPDYLLVNDHFKRTITNASELCNAIGINPIYSEIKLDGGNIVSYNEPTLMLGGENRTIITDRIFQDNAGYKQNQLVAKLEDLLESEIIIIPQEPHDITGHADGILRFINSKEVFVNNYRPYNKSFDSKLKLALARHNIKPVPFSFAPKKLKNKWGDYTALGYYINYLQLGGKFFLPQFEDFTEDDFNAIQDLAGYYGENFHPNWDIVFPIQVRDLAMEGGVLNCISWTIKVVT